MAPAAIPSFDAWLGGGFPRGQVSELIGPRSSARTSVLLQALAAATRRGELVALVDALDMLDVESAAAAGIDLDRLLWIRGRVVTNPGMCHDLNLRALEQVIRALALVLQAGNFGLVVLDVAEAPAAAIRRLPFTTWMRLHRMIEGTQTVCLLVGSGPLARSSAGLTINLGDNGSGASTTATDKPADRRARFSGRLFRGLDTSARIVRARAGRHAGPIRLATIADASTDDYRLPTLD